MRKENSREAQAPPGLRDPGKAQFSSALHRTTWGKDTPLLHGVLSWTGAACQGGVVGGESSCHALLPPPAVGSLSLRSAPLIGLVRWPAGADPSRVILLAPSHHPPLPPHAPSRRGCSRRYPHCVLCPPRGPRACSVPLRRASAAAGDTPRRGRHEAWAVGRPGPGAAAPLPG